MLAIRIWSAKVGILALYCVCLQSSKADQESSCSPARVSDVKVYVIGKRDKTGQYVSTIELHLGAENGRDAYNWTVNVGDYTDACGGTTFSQILVDSTVPVKPGYKLFPGVGYYKFHTSAKKWWEGKKICEDEGAHLVIINSLQELGVIKLMQHQNRNNIKNTYSTGTVAVGFHDQYVEGEYVTIFGEPLESTGFHQWSKVPVQQPDNHGSDTGPGEDCGSIHADLDGFLNDVNCDGDNYPFVCEQELARPVSVNNVCIK